MNIACISASQVPSTTANSIQVMKACQALSGLGHEVCLLLPGLPPQASKSDLDSYYGIETNYQIQWLALSKKLHRYDFALHAVQSARRQQADLCYVWLLQAGVISLLAGLPVMLELHGPPEGRFGPALFRLFQRLPGKKRLLPITHALGSQIRSRYNTAPDLICVSPNGVDLEQYSSLPEPASARSQLGLPDKLTIGYTGHLYPGRGMKLLVELARRFPQLSFLWVGGRPEDVHLWQVELTAEKLANITLTGFVHNRQVPLYQAACEVLLMPYETVITGSSGGDSTSYASPMKMFEYMASSRAIISSDLPVIRELLNSSNAVLCPPGDVEAWSGALASLVGDVSARNMLARQAWQDIQGYSWRERARKALDGF